MALEPLIREFVPLRKDSCRHSVDDQAAPNGILYVLHTGIPWEDLPQELGFGSGITCWRRLRDWQAAGLWNKLHLAMLIRLREHDQIDWSRASIDGASLASPRGAGNWPKPNGPRKAANDIVVDARGVPLAITVTGENRHDSIAFESTLDAIPAVPGLDRRLRKRPGKLHADKDYDHSRRRRYLRKRGITARITRKGIESKVRLGWHRWVVEQTHSWFAGFGKLRIRFERRLVIHKALLSVAPTNITSRFGDDFY